MGSISGTSANDSAARSTPPPRSDESDADDAARAAAAVPAGLRSPSAFDRFDAMPDISQRLGVPPEPEPEPTAIPEEAAAEPAPDEPAPSAEADSFVPAAVAGAVAGTDGRHIAGDAIARRGIAEYAPTVPRSGTVAAAVYDTVTDRTFTAQNVKEKYGPPADLHPVLQQRLDGLDASRAHGSRAATHAEVVALSEALHARDAHYAERAAGTGPARAVTEADLPTMTLETAWTRGSNPGGMDIGHPAPRCANCTQLTDGVRNRAGDSPAAYDVVKATDAGVVPDATPPASVYAIDDAAGMRRGALVGGISAAGASTVEALADGELTGAEIARVATDAGTGVATGAAGDVIEQRASRAIDAAFGPTTAQQGAPATARVAGSRLAGAGVAGGVIGAGFATVDQVGAYRRGEVTASEAVGTVVAEGATGIAAGVAGAAAGAAVGSIIPGAGTVVGGVVGFGVGMAAGYGADLAMRASGAKDAIAENVTGAIDSVSETVGGWGRSLSSAFGW